MGNRQVDNATTDGSSGKPVETMMADKPQPILEEEVVDDKIEQLIDGYVTRFFAGSDREIIRIRRNIWSVEEELYAFNIIVTSILVIFDANMFESLPDNRQAFFEELLALNAHQTKSSKLCLTKNRIHLRIIRGLEDFDYSEFVAHVNEYRELFPVIQSRLLEQFYPDTD
jgi:hypothetical protein